MEVNDIVRNVKVFGISDAIKRARYSDALDITSLSGKVTTNIANRASAPIGTGEDQFLNGIIVQCDLTLTTEAWIELYQYDHIGLIGMQSLMNKINEFELDDQYVDYVDHRIIDIMNELQSDYNRLIRSDDPDDFELAKKAYLRLLYSNPLGFRISAGITTNYLQLKTMYFQMKMQRLPEFQVLCNWIETLPQFSELILKMNEKKHRITREEIEGV